MKKTSAILCAVLAGSLGFSTLASAQERGHHGGHAGAGHAQHFRGAHEFHGHAPRFEQHAWARHEAPRYVHGHPHFYRGGFLPYAYRQPAYYVDWRSYPGLYAPPYGYQWINVGGDLLLVAVATGLIANALTY